MHVSPLEEYGLRCALQLAKLWANKGRLAAPRVAELEGLSVEYVSKIMYLFRKAKLVKAIRGMEGGFLLTRPPSEIQLINVFQALKVKHTKEEEDFCGQFKGQCRECVHIDECSIRPVWVLLSSYFDQVLTELSLQDLLNYEKAVHKRVEAVACQSVHALKDLLLKSTEEKTLSTRSLSQTKGR